MKNIINYYYGFNVLNVYILDNNYYFTIDGNNYFFIKYNRSNTEINPIYNIYLELVSRNIMTNDIILNRFNQIVTPINNNIYILIRERSNGNININDILYIQNNTFNISKDKYLLRIDWVKLWSLKIDYYEEQTKHISKDFTLLNDSIDYYIGLGENAISYFVFNNIKIDNYVLAHRRINLKSSNFYNPINYIIDSRVRDFSEYIKFLFFEDKMNIDILKCYLDYINFTKSEYILFISRLLFPTYYFDMFDEIISNNINEDAIKKVLNKSNDYITFIKSTMYYIIYNKKINIPYIDWIN